MAGTDSRDLLQNIEKMSPRMLSKELKELELNGIVQRKLYDQTPVLTVYISTESRKDLIDVVDTMLDWGLT